MADSNRRQGGSHVGENQELQETIPRNEILQGQRRSYKSHFDSIISSADEFDPVISAKVCLPIST